MKKVILVCLFLIVLATVVVGFILFSDVTIDNKTDIETASLEKLASSTEVVNNMRGKGSLEELLAMNKNLECTVIYKDDISTGPMEGTYFTADQKMRGDFVLPEMGENSVSSFILRDQTLYSWSIIDGNAYGMKITLAKLAEAKASTTALATREPVPLSAKVSYECKNWSPVDKSIFELPQSILFNDYAELTTSGMEDGTTFEAVSPCDVCDGLTDANEKTTCRASLSCL